MATWPDRRSDTTTPGLSVLELERDRLLARLRTDCAEGRISLERFSDLIGDVYAARSSDELRQIPLPAPAGVVQEANNAVPATPARVSRPRAWVVAVFGNSAKKGHFRLDEDTTALAVFGDCSVDLTSASLPAESVALNAISMFGSVNITVPDGVEVVLEGASIFGNRRCDLDARSWQAGAPVLVVRAWACFGDVRIRAPKKR